MSTQANGTGQAPTDQPNGQGQAPAGQTPAGQGQAPAAPATSQQAEGQPDLTAITDPNLRSWVEAQARQAAEARQEAARYRTERNALQTQQEQARQASLSDEQRAQEAAAQRDRDLEALKTENRDLKVGTAARAAASSAGCLDTDVAYLLLKDRIVTDDAGKPTNVEDLVNELKTTHPFLFRRVNADAGAGAGGAPNGAGPTGTGMNDMIRQALVSRRVGA